MQRAAELSARFPDLPEALYVHGVSRVKWPDLRRCFPGRRLIRLRHAHVLPADAWIVAWGMTPLPEGTPASITVIRIEDGFLRSVGLGVDLVRPLSWVIDKQGMHFDATHPSDLETILATTDFGPELCRRAAALRARIVAGGITKYNVGGGCWRRPPGRAPVILVPGQVPTDAALSFAALRPTANLALLQAVRAAHPEAYVVYKVHPDIVARMRTEKESLAQVREQCDEVVGDVNMAELLAEVDAVHVLTSLTGFEALLRGVPVTCHGRPFYSGWGLTRDLEAGSDRRQRKLALDQLVAGALILYPVYLDRSGPGLITPEQALEALASRQKRREPGNEWWQGAYRMALRRVVGVR